MRVDSGAAWSVAWPVLMSAAFIASGLFLISYSIECFLAMECAIFLVGFVWLIYALYSLEAEIRALPRKKSQ